MIIYGEPGETFVERGDYLSKRADPPGPVLDERLAVLLAEIESEPVPERLLELAMRLQLALRERGAAGSLIVQRTPEAAEAPPRQSARRSPA